VKERREAIEAAGTQLAFVYEGSEKQAAALFARYGLDGVSRFRDPDAVLYRAFGLHRGKLFQLFGLRVLRRYLQSMSKGHGPGIMTSDGLQLPGVFLLHQSRIIKELRYGTVADRPDYVALASLESPELEDSSPESGSAILTPPPRLKWQVGDLPDACLRK